MKTVKQARLEELEILLKRIKIEISYTPLTKEYCRGRYDAFFMLQQVIERRIITVGKKKDEK